LAERKRRGDDAVDDRLDETVDDETALDDELADDELDDDDLDDDLDDDEDEYEDDEEEDDDESVAARSNGRGRGTSLTKTKTKDKLDAKSETRPGKRTKGKSTRPGDKKSTRSKSGDRPNIFGRFANFVRAVVMGFVNFVREVVAELRKVIWPTRKELLTYTAVVVVFVALMLSIVAGLDWVFAKGILWVFGDGESAAE
jgi:preprotein translocase subunit SecE